MSRPGALMPIGGLARLSRLTVKALRLYGAEGLLVPAWVDPDSGYRYYRAEQVRTATTIALLRSLDVPLAAREQALRSIGRLARSPAAVTYDMQVGLQPVRRLAGLTAVARTETIAPDTIELCLRVAELLGDGEITTLYPLDLEETFPLTAGIVGKSAVAGAEEHELAGGEWASTLHVGAYEELPVAYAALLEHLRERGHEPPSPIVETYLNHPGNAEPHELVTRVAVALR